MTISLAIEMPEKTRKIFIENLKRMMENRKIKGNGLASALGVSGASVTRWLHGEVFPAPENIDKLAEFFQVPVEYFYRENEWKPSQVSKPTLDEALALIADQLGYQVRKKRRKGK